MKSRSDATRSSTSTLPVRVPRPRDFVCRILAAAGAGALLCWPAQLSQAGDILRNGAGSGDAAKRNPNANAVIGAEAAAAANLRAQDQLSRTASALQAVRNMAQSAQAPIPAGVPDGLQPGGLKVLTGPNARWDGANLPVQTGNNVTIQQNESQAVLHWETFNVGRNTKLIFDQSKGGDEVGHWIAFNKVYDPTGKPSQILGSIKAAGQVYVINGNGILFAPGAQVNTRSLVASSVPINDTLVQNGLLNNPEAQFLFSTTAQGAFTPPPTLRSDGHFGDVVVESGAQITSSLNLDGGGGSVMLFGANVTNRGVISTPAGQTIMAAGLQIGLAGHRSDDPSLRGLDVWVGNVGDYAGRVENSGLIDAQEGSVSIVGKDIFQLGAIDSSSSVNLNGRIDINASYGAVGDPTYDDAAGVLKPPFLNRQTGTVTFGSGSVTRILPDYLSDRTLAASSLPERSQINVRGKAIHFEQDSLMLAPNGDINISAGTWPGNNLQLDGDQVFFRSGGQVYLESGALISAAGTTEVLVPLSQQLLTVTLRGAEFADSPLQRTGALRTGFDPLTGKENNVPITVDLRLSGSYNGRFWVGTPLGDITGFAALVERNAAQLTAAAGNVTIEAGGSIVAQRGSVIDVSGGTMRYEGVMVETTRLLYNGRLIDIKDATPDIAYEGVYTGQFTQASSRWGVTKSYKVPWMTGAHYEPESVGGANGGTITLSAPSMALDGEMHGNTVTGARQRSSMPLASTLNLNFSSQRFVLGQQLPQAYYPTPPNITFQSGGGQRPAEPFKIVSGEPAALRDDRVEQVQLSPSIFTESGFGNLAVDNSDGDVSIPAGEDLVLPPQGSLTVKAANIEVGANITAPGGDVSFTAYNFSPGEIPALLTNVPPPLVNPHRGNFTLAPGARISTAGLIVDDRLESPTLLERPLVMDGGSINIESFNADLGEGSLLDVSGGVRVDPRGKRTYGAGGQIVIRTGIDPNAPNSSKTVENPTSDARLTAIIGGTLHLGSELRGFSGAKGGALTIQSMLIQVGGGAAAYPNTLVLQPEFFQQGGFTEYNLVGIGAPATGTPVAGAAAEFAPAIYIMPGTVIEPRAESYLAILNNGTDEVSWRTILKPTYLRSPASVSFQALGSKNDFLASNQNTLVARGDIIFGQGARIETDPGASVTFKGQTVDILGSVTAPGGSITVTGANEFPLADVDRQAAAFGLATVHIGPQSRLSTAGITVLRDDPYGRRIGQVLNGGTISIAGNIVAEAGAFLDVSGASSTLDLHPSLLGLFEDPLVPYASGLTEGLWRLRTIPTRIDSSGGRIALAGGQFLFSDATLLGEAGGPGAVGGTLSVFSGRFYTADGSRTSADINLVVGQDGNVIPGGNGNLGIGRPVLGAGGTPLPGIGYFNIGTFDRGGFDNLDLGGDFVTRNGFSFGGNVRFEGPVNINARGWLRLAGGGVIEADSPVSLNAPYIGIGQAFRAPQNPTDPIPPLFTQLIGNTGATTYNFAPTSGPGRLSLNAEFIDVGTLSLQGIGRADFTSATDIRGNGTVNIAGDLTLTARQIYPTTLSEFNIFAYNPPGGTGSVTIVSNGVGAVPLSAGGRLNIFASQIIQGGTLRAPFGSIILGWDGTDFDPSTPALDAPKDPIAGSAASVPVANEVVLKSGSLTSVSAVSFPSGTEIVIPFGLSPDGFSWIDPRGVNVTLSGLPVKNVSIAGNSVITEAGSIIDLRGGGDLYAFRWVPGPGGSVDLTGSASAGWSNAEEYSAGDLVTYRGDTYSARTRNTGQLPGVNLYWTKVTQSFAILPDYQFDYAPYAPFYNGLSSTLLGGDPGYVSSGLTTGDQIYLDGIPGLRPGSYTLLPARYGLLPGALLVTPQAGDPIGLVTTPEGASLASGYRFNQFDQPREFTGIRSRFEVTPFDVTRGRAAYADYLGNEFFSAAALRYEVEKPQRLPWDAGYLSIQGNVALSLQNSVLSGFPTGGRGAEIDVSSFADMYIIGSGSSAPLGAKVVLDPAILSEWGAESLIIGGLRRRTEGSFVTNVDVRTSNLVLDNAGDPLSGPDVSLVSRRDLTLAPGAILQSTGDLSQPSDTFIPQVATTITRGGSLSFASGGNPIAFPQGTGDSSNRIRISVPGTITLADGTQQAVAANTDIQLTAGSSITLSAAGTITFPTGPVGSTINIGPLGDGVLVRVTADGSVAAARPQVVDRTPLPQLTVGAGAQISGAGVILDSSYGTNIDPLVQIQAQGLILGSGQISIRFDDSLPLTGSVVNPHLVLQGAFLDQVQSVQRLSLRSYRSIDLYGAGSFGSSALQSLELVSSGLRGYGQGGGEVAFTAGSILLDDSSNAASLAAPGPVTGSLRFDTGMLSLGTNLFALQGYQSVTMQATGGILGVAIGENTLGRLTTRGDLTMITPVITGLGGATQQIVAAGALEMLAGGSSTLTEGLGASFSFQGSRILANSDVVLPSGEISLRALTGDVLVNGRLDVSGREKVFYNLIRYSDAGRVTITADLGNVALNEDSTASVAGTGLADAGTVIINASQGSLTTRGTLLGNAESDENSGSFIADIKSLADYSSLNEPLQAGGFFNERNIRVRQGSVLVDQYTRSLDFTLSVDQGNITVTSEIDASGEAGGKISLVSGGNLTLASGAFLNAHGVGYSSAGKGGDILLEAGASNNGTPNLAAILDIQAGSTIDLGVDASANFLPGDYTTPGSAAFFGLFEGKLHLRAPRNAANNDFGVAAIGGNIIGASAILAEGYRTYNIPGAAGTITTPMQTTANNDAAAFMANYDAIHDRLLGPGADPLDSAFVIAPGIEMVNTSGDLTLGASNSTATSDWNLATWRYGPKNTAGVLTLRAKGDVVFFNALSDGFAGDINVQGQNVQAGQSLWLSPLMDINPLLPTNAQSWSYRITAGADTAAADYCRVLPLDSLAAGKGNVLVGKLFSDPTLGQAANANATTQQIINNRFQVIRTGAGDIDIAAGRDVQLRNQFATIYTAGVRLPYQTITGIDTAIERTMGIYSPGDFYVPIVELAGPAIPGNSSDDHPGQGSALGGIQQSYPAQYSMAGGDVTINAQQDIRRVTSLANGTIVTDSSQQLPMNWLYRRGSVGPDGAFEPAGVGGDFPNVTDPSASTTWWIDFSNFFEGVGALGGGDVTMLAGNNITNVDAVIPTNARMPGRREVSPGVFENVAPDASKLHELGGGDLVVRAGNDLSGGAYYVERGEGTLFAGGSIITNSSRTPSLGNLAGATPQVLAADHWLPTTLFVGKSQFDVSARGNVLLGPIVNPFMLPQGINNKFWYKTYFSTLSADSSVDVTSFGGSVTHRLAVPGETKPILQSWMESQDLLSLTKPSGRRPWIRLAETDLSSFSTAFTVAAATLRSTAFAGDVIFQGYNSGASNNPSLALFPSATGTLEVAASGNITGTLGSIITVSDADPTRVAGITNPFSYLNVKQVGTELPPFGGVAGQNTSQGNFLGPVSLFFQDRGSYTGANAAINVQRSLHSQGILHATDGSPVRLFATGGDISGFRLFTPKFAEISAEQDIYDVGFYIQNARAGDVSFVSAGRDLELSRTLQQPNTGSSTIQTAFSGDIQVSGPGALEVLAGRDVDLGNGLTATDGTGVGITSIGNFRNPFLPNLGAELIVLAGIAGPTGTGPALGLAQSSLDIAGFASQLGSDLAGVNSAFLAGLGATVTALNPQQIAIVALEAMFEEIRLAGTEGLATGSYARGYTAIDAFFGATTGTGNILTRSRDIRTTSGGAINIATPGGGLTLAESITGDPLTPPGVITVDGGAISILVNQDVSIGQARIFTLGGGDITIWSSAGNIAAGTAARTVVTAPPTRVVIDATSAEVQADLGGRATGGGIGSLQSREGVEPANVALIAPVGTVDAGDAGIRSSGNITVAAATVINASNIQAQGSSAGVPTGPAVSAPNVGGLTGAANSAGAGASAATTAAEKARQESAPMEETPSIIQVDVVGYGGGEEADPCSGTSPEDRAECERRQSQGTP